MKLKKDSVPRSEAGDQLPLLPSTSPHDSIQTEDFQDPDPNQNVPAPEVEEEDQSAAIDHASEESFPASDPPSHNAATA